MDLSRTSPLPLSLLSLIISSKMGYLKKSVNPIYPGIYIPPSHTYPRPNLCSLTMFVIRKNSVNHTSHQPSPSPTRSPKVQSPTKPVLSILSFLPRPSQWAGRGFLKGLKLGSMPKFTMSVRERKGGGGVGRTD
jgi:hypothetical protein